MPSTLTVSVRIPAALREYCRGASRLELPVPAASPAFDVGALLERIEAEYPRLYPNICLETGAVRPHINVFVNNDSVRDGAGLRTPLMDGDVVTILTAVSGG
jgi:molybdopterin converting factor small subunit